MTTATKKNLLVALGGNLPLGKRSISETLEIALEHLGCVPGLHVVLRSRWWQAPAFPPGSGPNFVNGAALLTSERPPLEVLTELHRIEAELGRTRSARWEPRVCDLDIIACEDVVMPDRDTVSHWMEVDPGKAQTVTPPRLILPHPRMHERAFVLIPLSEIAAEWRHPITGRTVTDMIADIPEDEITAIKPLAG